MTKNEIREALRANDEDLAMALLEAIMKASTLDEAAGLLEDIQVGERANTVEDICIDLADFEEHEAVEIIKANY
jgi:hypothetical protein